MQLDVVTRSQSPFNKHTEIDYSVEAETYIRDIKLQKLIKNETTVLQGFFCKIDRFGNNSIMVKVPHRTSKTRWGLLQTTQENLKFITCCVQYKLCL